MAEKIGGVGRFLWRHKYIVTLLIFGFIVGFIDDNSFWNRYKLEEKNSELRNEIAAIEKQYKENMEELNVFETNPKAYERVARVDLYMRGEDEDVFIVTQDTIK